MNQKVEEIKRKACVVTAWSITWSVVQKELAPRTDEKKEKINERSANNIETHKCLLLTLAHTCAFHRKSKLLALPIRLVFYSIYFVNI